VDMAEITGKRSLTTVSLPELRTKLLIIRMIFMELLKIKK
jgi:hypothetical protein